MVGIYNVDASSALSHLGQCHGIRFCRRLEHPLEWICAQYLVIDVPIGSRVKRATVDIGMHGK